MKKQSSLKEHIVPQKVFFPVTGNPIGFHHLILAECVLQQFESVKEICFILSNGIHPDPHKNTFIPEKSIRLLLMQSALNDFTLPQLSHVAQLAEKHQVPLKLRADRWSIDLTEFQDNRSFRLVEHVHRIQKKKQQKKQQKMNPSMLPWVMGSDLLQRMANSEIFSDADLEQLEAQCYFLIAAREGIEPEKGIQELQQIRGFSLNFIPLRKKVLAPFLQPFLNLSSTTIRDRIHCRKSLEHYLPKSAISVLNHSELYF